MIPANDPKQYQEAVSTFYTRNTEATAIYVRTAPAERWTLPDEVDRISEYIAARATEHKVITIPGEPFGKIFVISLLPPRTIGIIVKMGIPDSCAITGIPSGGGLK